jgi:hypothetical protein
MTDFELFYNLGPKSSLDKQNYKCLIRYNNKNKIIWDIFIGILLIIVCLFIPANLAFIDVEPLWITLVISFLDFIFLIDMVLCFITSYMDEDIMTEVVDRKIIAFSYLKTWFLVDLLSILPINMIVMAF